MKEDDVKTVVACAPRTLGAAVSRPGKAREILLACGIASSLLYVTTITVGAMRWEGYNSSSQTISELFALDAPSRSLVVPLLIAYDVLLYAFGVGVWRSAGGKRTLRVAAALMIGKEVLGFVATLITPMHMRGVAGTLTDALHAILTAVGVFLCMLPAMGFGAAAFGKGFRVYTIATVTAFVVCGVWGFMDGPRMAANLSTPWLGIRERINAFSYMIWIVVLAIALMRAQTDRRRIFWPPSSRRAPPGGGPGGKGAAT